MKKGPRKKGREPGEGWMEGRREGGEICESLALKTRFQGRREGGKVKR